MNSSPLTSWDGAEAYFTFAGSGLGTGFWLLVAVVLVAGSIWYGTRHEARDFAKWHKTHPHG
ncbi:hypothetical protein [Lutibaculum baratangense]|uniref:Uncharacterized protein n=1 Tax=Lutibaculum baratangense AMV1 TaxID=631454 RepID=V4RR98_9HYPH|nr:hypothetical protein [Lutibaculum baratangense]ESR25670.1 hypothetical protein N177_1503 [Lutibaculum baratangense AMV1]